ncbi:MAG: VOC family protein [Planctomycetales bacterium]|nr:VOC family protein [Planctomycetales bacterium]
MIENAIPVLPVSDLPASLQFYVKELGFQVDWGGEPGAKVASVSRDGCPIMLSQSLAPAGGAWVWLGVQDASLFDQLRSRGVRVVQEPCNDSWAYEMKFADPDGNVLWLGTEPRTDLPLLDASD